MLERDYLMRFLTVFAKALAEAIAKRGSKHYDDGLAIISDAFSEDKEASGLVDLPLDKFIYQVDFMEDFNARKWSMAAEMLQEKALILKAQGKLDESQEFSLKSLHLVLEVLLSDPETYRQSSLDLLEELRKTLSTDMLPNSTLLSWEEYTSQLPGMN